MTQPSTSKTTYFISVGIPEIEEDGNLTTRVVVDEIKLTEDEAKDIRADRKISVKKLWDAYGAFHEWGFDDGVEPRGYDEELGIYDIDKNRHLYTRYFSVWRVSKTCPKKNKGWLKR